MKENPQGKHWLLHTLIFTAIFVALFVNVSYVMRNIPKTMRNFKLEPAPVDMLFIGGSSTLVYWIPMQAYGDCGVTSYNYSGNSMSPTLIKNLIIESRKSQTVKLYLIDLRAFEFMQHKPTFYSEEYLRLYTDAIPYSLNRHNMINYAYAHSEVEPKNKASVYLDLIYYHGNWRNLKESNFCYNKLESSNGRKGFVFFKDKPEPETLTDYSKITAREPLTPDAEQTLRDLLDYCKAEGLDVLFYINPFSEQQENVKMCFNSVEDIVSEYGFPFLDANNHYESLALNPDTDFYNVNHVNILGAQKYTAWMTQYITEHYDMPDHREEAAYESWNTECTEFSAYFAEVVENYMEVNGINTEGSHE